MTAAYFKRLYVHTTENTEHWTKTIRNGNETQITHTVSITDRIVLRASQCARTKRNFNLLLLMKMVKLFIKTNMVFFDTQDNGWYAL